MKNANEWKKVFCIEGLWDKDLKIKSSIEPILELLHKEYHQMEYIYRNCATVKEFEFNIKKWVQKGYDDYSILYISSHGNEKNIWLSNHNEIEILKLSKLLSGKCKNRIIMFAACGIMDLDEKIIKSFINETECLAICGYRNAVYWIQSAAFDLLLLEIMQDNEFSGRGIGAISKNLKKIAKAESFSDLGFMIQTK
jgi:hypothetical protein